AMDVPLDSVQLIIDELKVGKYSRAFLLFDAGKENGVKTIVGTQHKEEVKPDLLADFIASGAQMKVYIDDEYRVYARVFGTASIVVFHLPLAEVHSSLSELSYIFSVGSLAALLVLGIAIASISALFTQPILSLAQGTDEIAKGNYDYRLPV